VLGALALLLALAYRSFGLAGAAAFVVPPAMMLQAAEQHLDSTTRGVWAVRVLRDELDIEVRRRQDAEAELARLRAEGARVGQG